MIELFSGNCLDIMKSDEYMSIVENKHTVIITDPPFNIGYHYKTYKDKMKEEDYLCFLSQVLGGGESKVLIHYPEMLHKISIKIGESPERIVSWVYNSNTARQHRDIAFYGLKPNFNQVRQEYKNLKDKRIQQRIAEGKLGAKLYDWWNVNQVKNISKEKTHHPCQMPISVMNNIIGILPKTDNLVVIDPFMGSGTTGVACVMNNVDFIGIEIDEDYFRIAEERIKESKR